MKQFFYLLFVCLLITGCEPNPREKENMQKATCKNSVVEAIMNRRSIRSYRPDQITQNQLDTIVQCAINAPSALNKQPWVIRVIQNPELLKQINEGFVNYAKGKSLPGSASKAQSDGFSVFHSAPTLMVVACDSSNAYSAVDCGLLGQNVLLAAESMQIGTCVIGGVIAYLNTPEAASVLQQFNLPEGYQVLFTIAMGYKNEQPDAKPRDANKVQIIQ